jgi:uncharacterized protein (TIGR02118 family)
VATQRLFFLLRRLPHLSREQFQHYWWNNHAPLVASRAEVLGIRRYQQVHTVQPARPDGPEVFDGIAELWFDGPAPSGTPEQRAQAGADLLADERNFIDLSRSPIWMADEHLMQERPHGGLRLTAALRRKEGVTRDFFLRRWHDDHGPLALRNNDVFGFGHYVQLHTPADAEEHPLRIRRGAPEPFDGVSEIWLDDVNPDPAHAAAVRAKVTADEDDFLDRERSVLWFSEVRVVVDRSA